MRRWVYVAHKHSQETNEDIYGSGCSRLLISHVMFIQENQDVVKSQTISWGLHAWANSLPDVFHESFDLLGMYGHY